MTVSNSLRRKKVGERPPSVLCTLQAGHGAQQKQRDLKTESLLAAGAGERCVKCANLAFQPFPLKHPK